MAAKTVWMMAHYNAEPQYTGAMRYHDWGKYLVNLGYDVYIFCASYTHISGVNIIDGEQPYKVVENDGIHYIYLRTPTYVGSGIQRIQNMLCYHTQAMKYGKRQPSPDVIIARSPNPLACLAGIRLGKKYKAPCICDIVDLWPESIVVYQGVKPGNPLIRMMYGYEKWMYRQAAAVIFSMEGGKDYIEERRWSKAIDPAKIYHINMGVDLQAFDQNARNEAYPDPLLERQDLFKVVYCGAVRQVNHLKILCDAAQEISRRGYGDIFFMIHGDGDQTDILTNYCAENGINNVKFYGRILKSQIPYVLTHADVTVLNYQNTPLLRFGGSMNKMFEYFASGKPVITNARMGYSLIKRYHCGIETESDSPTDIADAIVSIYMMPPDERAEYGRRSRQVAEEYDTGRLCERLGEVIEYAMSKSGNRAYPNPRSI